MNFNIEEFTELAYMLNRFEYITSLRVQPLMVMGRATKNIEPTDNQYRKLVRELRLLEVNKSLHYLVMWGDPIDHLIRFRNDLKDRGILHICSNGDITVSPYLPLIIGDTRRHTIMEYINAGLISIWKSKIVQKYSADLVCIPDLGKPHFGTTVFQDESANYDLIDNKEAFVYD